VLAALDEALAAARRCGSHQEEEASTHRLLDLLWWGPIPVADAAARAYQIADGEYSPLTVSFAYEVAGFLEAMRDDEAASTAAFDKARAIEEERSLSVTFPYQYGRARLLLGDVDGAVQQFREEHERHTATGVTSGAMWGVVWLAQALLMKGDVDQAERLAMIARTEAGADDVESQVMWRVVLAGVAGARTDWDEAERLARGAVAEICATEALDMAGDAYTAWSDTLSGGGRVEEAAQAGARALELYRRRGNVVSERRVRSCNPDADAKFAWSRAAEPCQPIVSAPLANEHRRAHSAADDLMS
jgi:tetratricopeptide (TPR) repeat protein